MPKLTVDDKRQQENPDSGEADLEAESPRRRLWTPEEDDRLRSAVRHNGDKDWARVAVLVGTRSSMQCSQRWRKALSPNLVKGKWSSEEDERLKRLVAKHGQDWRVVSEQIRGRSTKQCRERYCKYLDPELKNGAWTPHEDRFILESRARDPPDGWAKIAASLRGRTDDRVKSRFTVISSGRSRLNANALPSGSAGASDAKNTPHSGTASNSGLSSTHHTTAELAALSNGLSGSTTLAAVGNQSAPTQRPPQVTKHSTGVGKISAVANRPPKGLKDGIRPSSRGSAAAGIVQAQTSLVSSTARSQGKPSATSNSSIGAPRQLLHVSKPQPIGTKSLLMASKPIPVATTLFPATKPSTVVHKPTPVATTLSTTGSQSSPGSLLGVTKPPPQTGAKSASVAATSASASASAVKPLSNAPTGARKPATQSGGRGRYLSDCIQLRDSAVASQWTRVRNPTQRSAAAHRRRIFRVDELGLVLDKNAKLHQHSFAVESASFAPEHVTLPAPPPRKRRSRASKSTKGKRQRLQRTPPMSTSARARAKSRKRRNVRKIPVLGKGVVVAGTKPAVRLPGPGELVSSGAIAFDRTDRTWRVTAEVRKGKPLHLGKFLAKTDAVMMLTGCSYFKQVVCVEAAKAALKERTAGGDANPNANPDWDSEANLPILRLPQDAFVKYSWGNGKGYIGRIFETSRSGLDDNTSPPSYLHDDKWRQAHTRFGLHKSWFRTIEFSPEVCTTTTCCIASLCFLRLIIVAVFCHVRRK